MIEHPAMLSLASIRVDGGTQPRACMDMMYVAELAQAIADGAPVPAIITFYDGADYWLADGFHRYHASLQLDRKNIYAEVKQGTRRDAVLFSVGANATHGLRRTNADKRRAVETLLNDTEWAVWSDREIARQCAVGKTLVLEMRRNLSGLKDQMPSERFVERNGTIYAMNTSSIGRAQIAAPLSEYESSLAGYRGYGAWQEAQVWEEKRRSIDGQPVKSSTLMALQSSDSNEWFTPREYIEAARELMGGIDVDPASCELANRVVRAARYYTKKDDGLNQSWRGRVWLNPPYGFDSGMSNQETWTRTLRERYESGLVSEAVLLVNANTEAKWFQPLYNYLICFTNHRIRFYNASGDSSQPTQGNALVYFGKQKRRFIELFSQFGKIMREARPDEY